MGGRPRGTIKTAAEKAAARRARPSLQEAAQRNELELLEILERIARDEKQPANARISAILAVFDRGRGKPVQAVDANLTGQLIVLLVFPSRMEMIGEPCR
jgi:hypothetical protein